MHHHRGTLFSRSVGPFSGQVKWQWNNRNQKKPRVHKISCPRFWGWKWLRQFCGHLEKTRSSCRRTYVHKIFLVLGGGGYFGFFFGGGECRFYFYGRGDFLKKNEVIIVKVLGVRVIGTTTSKALQRRNHQKKRFIQSFLMILHSRRANSAAFRTELGLC